MWAYSFAKLLSFVVNSELYFTAHFSCLSRVLTGKYSKGITKGMLGLLNCNDMVQLAESHVMTHLGCGYNWNFHYVHTTQWATRFLELSTGVVYSVFPFWCLRSGYL